jgi:hypothetical protein
MADTPLPKKTAFRTNGNPFEQELTEEAENLVISVLSVSSCSIPNMC